MSTQNDRKCSITAKTILVGLSAVLGVLLMDRGSKTHMALVNSSAESSATRYTL